MPPREDLEGPPPTHLPLFQEDAADQFFIIATNTSRGPRVQKNVDTKFPSQYAEKQLCSGANPLLDSFKITSYSLHTFVGHQKMKRLANIVIVGVWAFEYRRRDIVKTSAMFAALV